MMQLIRARVTFVASVVISIGGFAASGTSDDFDPTTLKKFTAGVPYLGKYETGLYSGGKNEMPEAHRQAGERIAATIRPLDTNGQPDDANGRILSLALGHSNCRMYFEAFQKRLGERAAELHPKFELLNAGTDAQQLPQIVRLEGPVWDAARKLTDREGHSSRQVQVLFLHTTYHSFRNRDRKPPGEFPQTMQAMQRDLAKVLAHCATIYPNLKIAYLTCDGFRHFTGFEPHVWQEAFAFKWLIESQIKHDPNTEFAGKRRRLPFLVWGPYIWDNTWDERYFSDGVHPTAKAQQVFVEKYWQQLRGDSIARPWFLKPSASKANSVRFFVDPATNSEDPERRMAYGLNIVPPWKDGGSLFINLPEHLEYMPGTKGIARHHDKRPNVWQISADGSYADFEVESLTEPGVFLKMTAHAEGERAVFEMTITNRSKTDLKSIRPLLCYQYHSLKGFPVARTDNFAHTSVVIGDKPVALEKLPVKNRNAYARMAQVNGCPDEHNWWAKEMGGFIEDRLDMAFTALTASKGDRKVVVFWTPGKNLLSNSAIPCIHADPYFGDLATGESRSARGILIFTRSSLNALIKELAAKAERPWKFRRTSDRKHETEKGCAA